MIDLVRSIEIGSAEIRVSYLQIILYQVEKHLRFL